MLPSDILIFGKDGNGDSNIDLKGSPEDAIATAYELVSHLGWEPNQPWLDEVRFDKNFKFEEAGFGRGRSVKDWVKLGVRHTNFYNWSQTLMHFCCYRKAKMVQVF